MFVNLISQFTRKTVKPAIDAKMRAAGEAWVAEARRLAPVDTGFLRSSLGYTYSSTDKRLILYVDASYGLAQEFGGPHHPAHPYMRPALSVIPAIWRGGLAGAITGHTTELQASNTPERYAAGYEKKARGKTRGARLKVGRGRFR